MPWLSWGFPYSVPQWFMAATILITWLVFRFGDRRAVPSRFYVIAWVSVVAFAALGLGIAYYPASPEEKGGLMMGFVSIYLEANAIYGAAVLGVLGVVALAFRGQGNVSLSKSAESAPRDHPTA